MTAPIDLAAARQRARFVRDFGRSSGSGRLTAVADDVDTLAAEVERLRARKGSASLRLEKTRQAAERLLRQELTNAGSGRDGHLNEDDLLPLFEALGAVFLDDPDAKLLEVDE